MVDQNFQQETLGNNGALVSYIAELYFWLM
jgi:hypothetical protein